MIQPVSSAAAAGNLAQSVEALSDVLRASTEQSLALSEKLLAVSVASQLQDPLLGSRIDTDA